MKKYLTIITLAAMLCTLAACGKNEEPSNTENTPAVEQSQEIETQPDPLAPTEETEDETEAEVTEAEVTDAPAEEDTTEEGQPDPLDTSAFSVDDGGGLVFTEDAAAESDRTLIAAAQALFDSACRTEFTFTVGCPYDVDNAKTITGEFDWTYYYVTTPGINSVADVLADYHKVFSSNHPDSSISSLYMDGEDGVYALCGGRGSDIYYSGSMITQVQSRSDSEIVFSVENYYDGTDWGEGAYTEYDVFSMVLEDGVWRVDQFILPY